MGSPVAQWSRLLGSWAQLVRLPNLFTAMADSAMGVLFVGSSTDGWPGAVLVLVMGASAVLYAAGAMLNDYFDRQVDAQERPHRPIPSGRVDAETVRSVGLSLLAIGSGLAWLAGWQAGSLAPGLVSLALAGLILAYDGWLKRFWIGPLAMAGCRMLNALMGMSTANQWPGSAEWLVAAALGLYVFGLSWFAREEVQPEKSTLGRIAGSLLMITGVGLLAALPWTLPPGRLDPLLQREPIRWYLFVGILALWIGFRQLSAVNTPSPQRVQAAVRQGILSIVFLDAAAVLALHGLAKSLIVLVLLVPATLLSHWVETT
ncbi:MAG: UbiA family prenyltransferase [Thermoguttaceae bacterium]|nr:UbiA family prenyltransferase [Thermoguttaceae bacterium]MDW8037666.1 UbiA family prenyltransferase [Thermoguttaceae bacterium]